MVRRLYGVQKVSGACLCMISRYLQIIGGQGLSFGEYIF